MEFQVKKDKHGNQGRIFYKCADGNVNALGFDIEFLNFLVLIWSGMLIWILICSGMALDATFGSGRKNMKTTWLKLQRRKQKKSQRQSRKMRRSRMELDKNKMQMGRDETWRSHAMAMT